jgi:pyridoxamine 5'-phosphate oxidase
MSANDTSRNDPLATLLAWRDEACASGVREPDAMVLATATRDGVPSARVVLFRGTDSDGAIRFFTNYESRKARELEDNPRGALVFHWAELGRQARVEGAVARLSDSDSDAYFASRPRGHQLGAWASPQSRPIASLADLLRRAGTLDHEYASTTVPRPPFWGGYRLRAERIELWVRGEDRLHERRLFERDGATWTQKMLAP